MEATFPEEFFEGDNVNGRVPCYEPTMEDLEDPEKVLKRAVALAYEKDTAFTKVSKKTNESKERHAFRYGCLRSGSRSCGQPTATRISIR